MRLTVFPYIIKDESHAPSCDIEGFDLADDGTLSFVTAFAGNAWVKRAATIKLNKSQIFQLQKVLEGHKLS